MDEEALSQDAKWRKICLETLNLVWKNPDAWIFQSPVVESPALPHEDKMAYVSLIAEPMDLRTLKKNIPAFRSPLQFEKDMLLIFQNCMTFNKPAQDAYEMGKDMEAFFLSKWELEQRKMRALEHYTQSIQLASANFLDAARKQAKQVSVTYDAVSRKVVDKSVLSTRTSPETILKRIRENKKFGWFELPVHQYSDIPVEVKKAYYAMIQTPMDFSTIKANLSLYPSLSEMRRDLELIVTNSIRFNPPESIVNLAARELQETIDLLFDPATPPRTAGWARVSPAPCPPELLPEKPQGLLRIRRKETLTPEQQEPMVVEEQPVVQPREVSMNGLRPMTPFVLPPFATKDWRAYARHLLSELALVKDQDRSLCWILQKPTVKYELPTRIKRLYCLTVPRPMDMGTIQAKLSRYSGVAAFEADMQQMLDNCLVFNDETQYPHKVGLVVQKHFEKYWSELRPEAVACPESEPTDKRPFDESVMPIAQWEELRTMAISEQNRPGLDVEHVTHSAPLNNELLYEWRVAQRFVFHETKRQKV